MATMAHMGSTIWLYGDKPRVPAILAYNTEPGLSLSESARMTFIGRVEQAQWSAANNRDGVPGDDFDEVCI